MRFLPDVCAASGGNQGGAISYEASVIRGNRGQGEKGWWRRGWEWYLCLNERGMVGGSHNRYHVDSAKETILYNSAAGHFVMISPWHLS